MKSLKSNTLAIIDVGSNSIRLVLFQYEGERQYKEIENIKVSARLQTYLNKESMLTNDGITVLVNTLQGFMDIIKAHHIPKTKIVATAALRQATNQKEIIDVVKKKLGITIDILDGDQEAFYGFVGAINAISEEEGITIDIGGGSTEISKFSNRSMTHSQSFPFGVLKLKKMFINNNVPTPDELINMKNFLQKTFTSIDWLNNCRLPIIGIGGSARTMVKIDEASKKYPLDSLHQYLMNLEAIVSVNEKLKGLSFDKVLKIKGLSKDRADIIFPAIQVFQTLYEVTNAQYFLLSQKGLRDGIFYEEQGAFKPRHNVIEEGLYQLAKDFGVDMDKRTLVLNTANLFFHSLKNSGVLPLYPDELEEVKHACYVYNIGEFINRDGASQHTFYILSHRELNGLTHPKRIKIALLASYHSKSSFKSFLGPFKQWFTKYERQKMKILGVFLKLSFLLLQTKRHIVEDVQMIQRPNHLLIEIYCNNSWQVEQHITQQQVKHIENALKTKVIIIFKQMNKG